MRGEERDINRLFPAPVWLGIGQVMGVLYDLGTYPGVVLSPGAEVTGEVYQITQALERQLDAIEEVWPEPSGEYARREVVVHLSGGAGEPTSAVTCLIYEVSRKTVADKEVIAGGDWLSWRRSAF